MEHKVYTAIVAALRAGRLNEPFSQQDFRSACPGLGGGTYQAFLSKHARGNRGGDTELLERVARGRYRVIRPIEYGV
jgi:hypothetical protein